MRRIEKEVFKYLFNAPEKTLIIQDVDTEDEFEILSAGGDSRYPDKVFLSIRMIKRGSEDG